MPRCDVRIPSASTVVTMFFPLLIGCADELTSPVDPPSGMRPGVVAFYGDSAHVTLPRQVAVGSAAVITVLTWGDGCLRKGRTDVTISGRHVTIRPFDLITAPTQGLCPSILRAVEHRAEVVFAEGGVWNVTVYGVKVPGDEPIGVQREIHSRD